MAEKGLKMKNKKKAIIWIIVGEVLVYLFLLVAFPAFKNYLYSCSDCTAGQIVVQKFGIAMWLIYAVPALIGAWFILVIRSMKGKNHENHSINTN